MPLLAILVIQIALAIGCIASAAATGSACAFALGLHALTTASAWWLAMTDTDRARSAPSCAVEPLYWSHVVSLQLFALAGGIALSQGLVRTAGGATLDRLGDLHPYLAIPAAATVVCALALSTGGGRSGGGDFDREAKFRRESRGLVVSTIIALVALHVASGEGSAAGQASIDAAAAVAIGVIMAMIGGATALDLRHAFASADARLARASDGSIEHEGKPPTARADAEVA